MSSACVHPAMHMLSFEVQMKPERSMYDDGKGGGVAMAMPSNRCWGSLDVNLLRELCGVDFIVVFLSQASFNFLCWLELHASTAGYEVYLQTSATAG